jgi:hypothetical protein
LTITPKERREEDLNESSKPMLGLWYVSLLLGINIGIARSPPMGYKLKQYKY